MNKTPTIVVLFVLLFIVNPIALGWLLSTLAVWYLEPLGLPHTNPFHAYGIALIVSTMTHQSSAADSLVPEEDPLEKMSIALRHLFIKIFVMYPIVVLMGWIFRDSI